MTPESRFGGTVVDTVVVDVFGLVTILVHVGITVGFVKCIGCGQQSLSNPHIFICPLACSCFENGHSRILLQVQIAFAFIFLHSASEKYIGT